MDEEWWRMRADLFSSVASTSTDATRWARLVEHHRVGIGAVLPVVTGLAVVAFGFVQLYEAHPARECARVPTI
jgi:hypothetical protein